MIQVPEEVLEGLEAVRSSGLTNMFDRNAVAMIASEMGYDETVNWVLDNKKEYVNGIFEGFTAGE